MHELFPEKVRAQVLNAIINGDGWKFDLIRSDAFVTESHGQAHCEAVLGFSHSLATRSEDISWVATTSTE